MDIIRNQKPANTMPAPNSAQQNVTNNAENLVTRKSSETKYRNNSRSAMVIILCISILISTGGSFLLNKYLDSNDQSIIVTDRYTKHVNQNTYQMVVLNSSLVYYGKLTITKANDYLLNKVFIINKTENDQYKLLRFECEDIGGGTELFIPEKSVSHWTNLESNSKVMTAIDDYLKSNNGNLPDCSR